MKILVAGATGFVGPCLVARLAERGDEVVAVSRDAAGARARGGGIATAISWDELAQGPPPGTAAVVNLAGENLFARRWSAQFKETLRRSRVDATRRIVEAIGKGGFAPKVLVNASAIGFYGPHGDEELGEDAPAGTDFLSGLCRDWEAEARAAEAKGVRVVCLRIGVVLGKDGGALKQMLPPFRMFAGGPVAGGAQWFSWIHREDLVGLTLFALDQPSLAGAVNATAPDPRTNRDFSTALGRALGRPSWLPMPAFLMRVLFGEVADVLAAGQRVLPRKAQAAGFEFRYARLEEALGDLLED